MLIRWREIEPEYLNAEDFNEKYDEITARDDLHKVEFFPANRYGLLYKTYQVKTSDSGIELRVCDENKCFKYIFLKNKVMTETTKEKFTGYDAYIYINEQYMENSKKSIYRCFSGNKYKPQYTAIKSCVPVQINYIRKSACNRIFKNCYKADVSSAFPSQITKGLPTLHDCKVVHGRIDPDEEYPFAFYTKSHHMKIYQELDTRDFNDPLYLYYSDNYNDSVKDEETILCKTAEYSLKDIFEKAYHERKENKDLKFFMNAFIGFCQYNGNPRLSAISAVVIARCNKYILDTCAKLFNEGNVVVYIATDSIVWLGKESSVATDDKYLGSFTYECKNGRFFGRGLKAYQVERSDGSVITKAGHIKNGPEKDNMKFGTLPPVKQESRLYVIENNRIKEVF